MFKRDSARLMGNGRHRRLGRIFHPVSGRALIVPMDQSVTIGALGDAGHADRTTAMLGSVGANAVIVHKGRARTIDPGHLGTMGLVIHLSAGTSMAPDANRKVTVGTVEDCVVLGADAVSVHVNVGSLTESAQLSALGAVVSASERVGLPVLAMMYARGPAFPTDGISVTTLRHLAAIATDLGADIVKLNYAGSIEAMNEVVESCPIPVVVAGGPAHDDDRSAIAHGDEVARTSVAGLSFGRSIFHATEPRTIATALVASIHGDLADGRRGDRRIVSV